MEIAEAKSNEIESRVDFQTERGGDWPEWDRFITLDGKRAHHIGNICGTCPFIFERLEGANAKVSPAELSTSLRNGISSIDAALTETVMGILPTGVYKTLLLSCVPQFISPSKKGDYFFEEQIQLWGVDGFWGVPHYTRNEYYRTQLAKIADRGALFEFIVPMFPKRYLHEETIDSYAAMLDHHTNPTALAVSILDVKHWCLAHYLLDGHHKMFAASKVGRSISLLSFLAVEKGISTAGQIGEVLTVLARE
jgi:hypothetical protein